MDARVNDDLDELVRLRMRLELIANSLSGAIDTVEGESGRRLLGGAALSLAAYLRTIQKIARGQVAPAPTPESLRVDESPTLRVVK